MNLKKLKIGQSIVSGELQMDVMEEVDHKGKWGWEVTDETGHVVDQKYGYPSHDKADKDGEAALKKLKQQKSHGAVEQVADGKFLQPLEMSAGQIAEAKAMIEEMFSTHSLEAAELEYGNQLKRIKTVAEQICDLLSGMAALK